MREDGLGQSIYRAIMHEVNNPLEAITNLVYLTKTQNNDPVAVLENWEFLFVSRFRWQR